MNQYLPFLPVLGIVSTITFSANPLLALERAEVSTIVKEITVQIEGEDTSGTGTIIEQDGDTYTVLTCWHVANTELGLKIVTADGETHEVTGVQNIDDGNIDLATIQFESNTDYELAELGDSEAIIEGANAYVVGYPDPIPGIPERGYDFQDTNITRKLQTGENGYRLVHNTTTTGGSSGGGIFDEDGVLIGIHGRTTSDAEGRNAYGLAIPLEVFFTEEANLTTPANFTPPQDYASLGRRKLNLKDYQGAVDDFSQVLAVDPNNFDALSGRAEAYFWSNSFDAAIKDYDLVLQQNNNNATYFFNRAYAHSQLKNHEKAIADYTEAIRLDPEDAITYYNRGTKYDDLKEYEKAIADYTEAIRL
ncbi:serine protease, partial [Waterburya agarophytonicola K14]|nr:serine protease [Waterburya agarophytonicola KI4]